MNASPSRPTQLDQPRRGPRGLATPLAAAVVATTLIAAVAFIRTGSTGWVISLARIVIMALLSVLVLRGKAWARWVLIVWYSLSAIVFFAYLIRVAAEPVALVLFIAMAALYIWAVLALVNADITDANVTEV